MFKGTGIDENLVIAFSDTSQAQKAVRQWEFSNVPGKVKKKCKKKHLSPQFFVGIFQCAGQGGKRK
jgi:hypothetical protein